MKYTTIFIILGILIRLILSIFTYHPDLGAHILAGKIILLENSWFTFYDASLPNHIIFNYPPLGYVLPSLIYLPFIETVKSTASDLINSHPPVIIYLPLLIYKLPMMLADISIIFLIKNLFKNKHKAKLAQIFYALNPIAIYVSAMIGQVDVILTMFLVIALIFVQKKRFAVASIFIAISALVKPIGLILFPLLFLKDYQESKNKIFSLITLIAGPLVYLIGIAPYINSINFRTYALLADQTSKSTFAGISIASGHTIPFFFIFYCLTLYLLWIRRLNLRSAISAALLSSLVFSHFHPQWLVWVTPLIIIDSLNRKRLSLWLVTVIAWILIVFSFDSSLHVGLFLSSTLIFTPNDLFNQYTLFVALARSTLITLLVSRYLK